MPHSAYYTVASRIPEVVKEGVDTMDNDEKIDDVAY